MTTHWTPEQLLEPGIGVILDTETTDLDGRIIEISIIDAATGTVLMNQLINPPRSPDLRRGPHRPPHQPRRSRDSPHVHPGAAPAGGCGGRSGRHGLERPL